MDATSKTIVIVRHGQRCDVVHPDLRFEYPNPLDPCLTKLGKYQAERTKLLLSNFTPPESSWKVVCSPFLACIETANLISANFTVDWRFSDLISIINYPMDISESITYKSEWFQQQFGNIIVSGEAAEYPEEYPRMKQRVCDAFNQYLGNLEEDVLVIVTHLLPLEVITQEMKQEQVRLTDDGFCCVTMAKYDKNSFQVLLTADHTHAPQYIRN